MWFSTPRATDTSVAPCAIAVPTDNALGPAHVHLDQGARVVRTKIEAWGRDYNASRPHSALGHLTPLEFAAQEARNGP